MFTTCRTDYTYDMFMEDAKLYKALPYKGVYPNTDNYRAYFMRHFKTYAENFRKNWLAKYGKNIANHSYWIGDAFADELDGSFSDFYKEAYGQRPHLPAWFYLQALDNFPSSEDTLRTFCARPIEQAIENARYVREMLSSMD